MKAHQRTSAAVTLWLVPMDDCTRYGAVDVARDGRVRSFQEKSANLGAGLINAAVYLFERRALEEIPTNRAVSLERETFPALIEQSLYATVGEGPFLDIGTPASYASAEQFIADNHTLWNVTSYG